MKTYLVHVEGKGEGCDYTIGCNHAVEFVQANSLDEAKEKWWQEFAESHEIDDEISSQGLKYRFEEWEWMPESVFFYELTGVDGKFDFTAKYRELWAEAMQKEKLEEEAQARAQYEELKKRFE